MEESRNIYISQEKGRAGQRSSLTVLFPVRRNKRTAGTAEEAESISFPVGFRVWREKTVRVYAEAEQKRRGG